MHLSDSYRLAARISRRARSSFYPSFWLLPREKRHAMCAFYAFARVTDDMADCQLEITAKQELLDCWRSQIEALLETNEIADAETTLPLKASEFRFALDLMPALGDASQRFQIPAQHVLELVDGAIQDQVQPKMETAAQLDHYCYLVAATVGLVCLRIWGFDESSETQSAAIECGKAFQLTNILRDIREDLDRDRFYLPLEDARIHGVSACSTSLEKSEPWCRLILQQCNRAGELFAGGWKAFEGIDPDGQRMFSMMWRSYRRLLSKIESDPAAVLQRRVRLSYAQKFRIASSHFIGPAFRRLKVPPQEISP